MEQGNVRYHCNTLNNGGNLLFYQNYNANGLVLGQETEEEQNVIGIAYASFVICDNAQDRPYSYMNSLLLQKCDYDIKFLKGLCESTNNQQYEYCTDTKMDSYLIVRGQYDAPRPNDVWCDHFRSKPRNQNTNIYD